MESENKLIKQNRIRIQRDKTVLNNTDPDEHRTELLLFMMDELLFHFASLCKEYQKLWEEKQKRIEEELNKNGESIETGATP